jgi:hypothetical protein
MSSRLQNDERLPFITDVAITGEMSQIIRDTRAQAEQLLELGHTAGVVFAALPRALRNLYQTVQDAEHLQDCRAPAFPGVRYVTNQLPESSLRTRILGMG